MPVKLTNLERISINDNRGLREQIATADVIDTVDENTGNHVCLWKRPLTEIHARGFPTTLIVLTFEVSNQSELDEYQRIIDRMKNSDGTH